MDNFSKSGFANKAPGFDAPTQLPRSNEEQKAWQEANKKWWETTPMRYDWRDQITAPSHTAEWYKEIDQRFMSSTLEYLPWKSIPFDQLIPYEKLRSYDVLEIGVGQGTHAQLLATNARSFTGIDLTGYAAETTSKRLKIFNIPGQVLQMDAERMTFPDNKFDYIWSWGVIHHSANTDQILKEMNRVLRPGGGCTVMVYYRSWWSYYFFAFLRSLVARKYPTRSNLSNAGQQLTDGAIARFYSCDEWRSLAGKYFHVEKIEILGLKGSLIPLPGGRLKSLMMRIIPNFVARFGTSNLAMGSFLVAHMKNR